MKRWQDRINNYVFLLLLILAGLFITRVALCDYENMSFNSEMARNMNKGWTYTDNKGEEHNVTLPVKMRTWNIDEIQLSYILPKELLPGMTVCVRTTEQTIEAFVEGERIYSFGINKKVPFGKSSGSAWNMIRIPDGSAGMKLTLRIAKVYQGDSKSDTVNTICYGSKSSLVFKLAQNYAGLLLISVIITILGILLLLVYFIFHRSIDNLSMTWSLGWFVVLIGTWMFAQSKLAQIFVANQFLVHSIDFINIMLFPIPLLQYIQKFRNYHYKRIVDAIISLFFMNFIVCIILQISNQVDFYESIISTHILTLIAIAVIGLTTAIEIIYYHNRDMYIFATAITVLFGFILKELDEYYAGEMMITGSYIGVGALIFTVILTTEAVKRMITALKMAQSAHYYEQLATTDLMTRCKNRTAYINELEQIEKENDAKESITICLMDINNLKEINDNFGHQMGDDAIIKCSEILECVFGKMGNCYRIGGDEFICIMHNGNEEKIKACEMRFLTLCERANEMTQYKFQVALGVAVYDKDTDTSIQDIVKRADANMYCVKNDMKKMDRGELY